MAAAKRRGVKVGRPRKLSPYQLEQASGMIEGGKARADVAALMGVNVATLPPGAECGPLVGGGSPAHRSLIAVGPYGSFVEVRSRDKLIVPLLYDLHLVVL